MEHQKQQNEADIYIFDEDNEVEPTPNFFSSTQKWDKFKTNVMQNKNQQFNAKILKQNILTHNSHNLKSQKKNIKQFLSNEGSQINNINDQDDFFVVQNVSQYDFPQQKQQNILNVSVSDDSNTTQTVIQANDLQNLPTQQPFQKKNNQKKKKNQKKSISGLVLNYHNDVPDVVIYDKRLLINTGLPQGIKLKCKLKRRKDLLSISPEYDFYLQSGFKHLASAQKRIMSQSKVFEISMNVGQYTKQSSVCDLRCNALHNRYTLIKYQQNKDNYIIFGQVAYGKLKKTQARDMIVSIPLHSIIGASSNQIKQFKFDCIDKKYKFEFQAKKNLIQEQYLITSQKNFELIDFQDDFCYLKLRKDSDNVFSIEIQHPLSPIQAFAIILTRFDAQIK